MADVTPFSPLWAETGTKRAFEAGEVTAGADAQEVGYQLFNSLFDREETKINAVIAQLPTEDQKAALDNATAMSASNAVWTVDDATRLYDYENKFIVFDHFIPQSFFNSYPGTPPPYYLSTWEFNWTGGTPTNDYINEPSGVLQLATNTTANDDCSMSSISSIDESPIAKNPVIQARIAFNQTADYRFKFGIYDDANNYACWIIDTSIGGSLRTETISGGTSTINVISGTSGITDYRDFKIVLTSSSVEFYLGGNLRETHTTNIPTTGRRYFYVETLTTSSASIKMDWFHLEQDI